MGGGGPELALAAGAPSATAMVVARPATASTRLDMTTPLIGNEGRRRGTPADDPSPCTAAVVCCRVPDSASVPIQPHPGQRPRGYWHQGEGSGSRTGRARGEAGRAQAEGLA